MLLAEAGCVFMGLILCISGPVKGSCRTSAKGDLKMKLNSNTVTEGQTVTMTCGGKCQPSINTTYSWYRNNQSLKMQENNYKLILQEVTRHEAGKYFCVMTLGNNSIRSHVETLYVTNIHASAAATGAGAAVLVTIPVIIFIWFRTKRTSGQSSTSEGTDNREQLDNGPVYDNIPAQGTEQDEPYYSTIHFPTVQPRQPTEHEHTAYTVVNFRPHV